MEAWGQDVIVEVARFVYYSWMNTVAFREIGTGISEASKRVPIFLHDVRGGKQVSSYFGQELRQVGLNRLRFGSLLHDLSLNVERVNSLRMSSPFSSVCFGSKHILNSPIDGARTNAPWCRRNGR